MAQRVGARGGGGTKQPQAGWGQGRRGQACSSVELVSTHPTPAGKKGRAARPAATPRPAPQGLRSFCRRPGHGSHGGPPPSDYSGHGDNSSPTDYSHYSGRDGAAHEVRPDCGCAAHLPED